MSGSVHDAWVAATFGVDPKAYQSPPPGGAPADEGMLSSAWSWTKDHAAAAGHAIGEFDDAHGHVLTRAAGAAQMVAGAGEAVAGAALAGVGGAATGTGVGAAPGIPAMIGGGALAVNGADNAQTGLRTLISGEFHHTGLSEAAGASARALGASDKTAERITGAVDLTQGIAGGAASAGVGIMRKTATAGLSEAAKAEQEAAALARAEKLAAGAGKGEKLATDAEKAAAAAPHVAPSLELADALSKAPKGSPERAKLIEDFAKQSTHVKPPPDRVVLGKWEPPGKGGYIDAAKDGGGVWYETPEGSYGMIGGETAWETNVAFLSQQLEKGIPKLEFANLDIDKALAEEAVRRTGTTPARIKEIQFLEEQAPKYGYKRVGNSFIKSP